MRFRSRANNKMDTSSMVERAVGRQDGYSGTGPQSPLRGVGGRGPTQDAALSTADTAWHVAQIEQGQGRGAAAPALMRATREGAGWGNNHAGALIAGAARGRRAGLSRGWARVSHGATGARDRRGRAWAMHSGAISGDGVPSGRSHRRVQSGRNRGALGATRSQSSAIRRSTRGRAKGAIGAQSGCTRRHSVTIQCDQALNSRARRRAPRPIGCIRGAIGAHSGRNQCVLQGSLGAAVVGRSQGALGGTRSQSV